MPDTTQYRWHSSSQTGDIGIYYQARAVAETRAMEAATFGVTDLELHRRELTSYCQRMVGASEADDAVQETMLRAWRAAATFDGRSSVRAWLYRIATNACTDLLRSRERRGRLTQRLQASASASGPAGTSAEAPATAASFADPAEFAATQDGVQRALAAMLGELPARQRAALILCEVLRWRSDEAAKVLGTSAAAVASSLQRARATLARQSDRRDPGDVDADQLARYQDAFRRYDIASLVGMVQVDACQAAVRLVTGVCGPPGRSTPPSAAISSLRRVRTRTRLLCPDISGQGVYGRVAKSGHRVWVLRPGGTTVTEVS